MCNDQLFSFKFTENPIVFDIPDFINKLPEPTRSYCHAMLIEGESSKVIANRFHMTPKTILRKTRIALAPLAVQYGITSAEKFLPSARKKIL